MGEFVWKKVGIRQLVAFIRESLLADALLRGLSMLQTNFCSSEVGKIQQEMIMIEMVRTIQSVRFANEISKLSQHGWAKTGILGCIGDDVNKVFGSDFRSQSKFVEVLACEDRRVFELFNVRGGKVRNASGGRDRVCAATDWRKRGANAPTGRDNHRRLNRNVADRHVGGIEQKRLPVEHSRLLRDISENDAIKMRVKRGDSVGDR